MMFIEKYESYFHLSIIRNKQIFPSNIYLLSSKIILKCFFPFRINELSRSIALILFFFFFFCQARIESIVATGPHEGKNGTKTTLASKESNDTHNTASTAADPSGSKGSKRWRARGGKEAPGGGTGSQPPSPPPPLEIRSCRAVQYRGNITLLPSFILRSPAETSTLILHGSPVVPLPPSAQPLVPANFVQQRLHLPPALFQ